MVNLCWDTQMSIRESDMKRVFLTGASGFVGQFVLRSLLARLSSEDRIHVLTRRPLAISDKRILELRGDLADLEQFDENIREADFIIHLAAEARLCGTHDYASSNVDPTRKLLERASLGGVCRKFIFVSSIAAMDRAPDDRCDRAVTVTSACRPRTEYGRSKLMAEKCVIHSGLPYTIFRPGFIFGPGMRKESHFRRFAGYIHHGVPLDRLDFPGKISLVHVSDLADAITRCLFADAGVNRTYLAVSHTLTMGQVMALLGESLTGHKVSQIKLRGIAPIIKRFHHLLPTVVACMFVDYFHATDANFLDDFFDQAPRLLSQTVDQVVADI